MLVASKDSARIWDVRTGKPVAEPFPHGEPISSVTFSADGSTVLTQGVGAIQLWRTQTAEPRGRRVEHGSDFGFES